MVIFIMNNKSLIILPLHTNNRDKVISHYGLSMPLNYIVQWKLN